MTPIRKLFGILILGLLLLNNVHSQTEEQLQYLDQYYTEAVQKWQVPGMAIALVRNDLVVFEKGYGIADLDSHSPVDENTLFAIASNTKAFTATSIGQLVEQNKLNWDDKVKDHLPWFKMYDPYVEKEMTIEDLLSHRSGLKTFSGDLLWFGTDKSAEEVVHSAKWLQPTQGFRSEYGYSNIMYIAAGLVIEQLTDTSYSDFITHHFFAPLGMTRTLTSVSEIPSSTNVATPYYFEDGESKPLEWLNWDNIVAAGGIISSVHDMANWLMMNINRGQYKDLTFLNDNTFEKLTTPHINFQINQYTREHQPSKHFRGYGLGWSLNDYHGKKIISHGGGYDGMISKTCIVPETGFGIVVLTNSLNYLPSALVEKTLDVVLGNETNGTDYADLYLQSFLYNQDKKEQTAKKFDEERGKINLGHLPFEDYTGFFRDKMYGDVEVTIDNGQLFFRMIPTQIFQASLQHWNDDIFTFRFDTTLSSLPPGKLWFELDKNGIPAVLMIDVENPDFDFREFEFVRINN